MTQPAPRYALYYTPAADSALWRFGSATLGYDAITGRDIAFAVPPGCEALDWQELIAEPRRYGFHATLKAPFELANGRNEGRCAPSPAIMPPGVRRSGLPGSPSTRSAASLP